MTLGHRVLLWKPGGSGLDPQPPHATGRLKEGKKRLKERVDVGKRWSEWGPKEGEEEVKGSWRWRAEGGKRWAKTSVGGGRGGGRAGSLAIPEAGWDPEHSARCEDRQSSVLQPSLRFNLSGKGLLFPPPPPNLLSHPLLYLRIHHPIHRPACSIGEPHRSDSTTLSNGPRWAQWNTLQCLHLSKSP